VCLWVYRNPKLHVGGSKFVYDAIVLSRRLEFLEIL